MTRASVLIPTHDHHATLALTVDSVLRQTVTDLEVLLIGDGVTPAVRAVIERLVAADPRVRFLDKPKGPHHGECYRHLAILEADSDAIFYLCDDDLLLPDHVADLLALLEDANFVQSFNGYCRPDGSVAFFAGDLANPRTVELMLDDRLVHNNVSITGTAHSRAFYLEVGDPWDTTPPGRHPDQHQWRKLWRHPSYRGATSHRMTTVQLPTSSDGRDAWTPEQRHEELLRWHELVTGPDAQSRYDEIVATSARRALGELRDDAAWVLGLLRAAEARIAGLEADLAASAAALADRDTELGRLGARMARKTMRMTRLRDRLARKNATLARLRAVRARNTQAREE